MARPGFWIDTRMNETIGSAAQGLESLMTNVSSTQSRRGWTMVRTIIGIDIARSVHDSGEGSDLVEIGIGVTSQEAFAAGVVPDPQTPTDHPTRGWVYRAGYRIWGFAADQPAIYTIRVDKDIRAKRKLDNGEMYIVIDNNPLEGTAGAILVTGYIRQYWLDE